MTLNVYFKKFSKQASKIGDISTCRRLLSVLEKSDKHTLKWNLQHVEDSRSTNGSLENQSLLKEIYIIVKAMLTS